MKAEYRDGIRYEYINCDVVEVTKNEKKLGDIFTNEGDWEEIANGADPVRDGWEDGNGHVLSEDGWTVDEYGQKLEDIPKVLLEKRISDAIDKQKNGVVKVKKQHNEDLEL